MPDTPSLRDRLGGRWAVSLRGWAVLTSIALVSLPLSAQITDDGLQTLAASKSLKKLSLSGVKNVTPAGIAKLKQAKPELVVESN